MAETVRIEIPVSVKDNTSSGVQSATQNLSGFEKSMKRTEQQLNRIDRAHHIRVDADDRASGTINKLSSATESLDGTDADVDILASDSASQIVNQVENQINALDGSAADVDVGANDTATQVVSAAAMPLRILMDNPVTQKSEPMIALLRPYERRKMQWKISMEVLEMRRLGQMMEQHQ